MIEQKVKNFEFIKKEDMLKIHETSVRILSEIGLNIYSEEIRNFLKENGAEVKDNCRVCFNEKILEKALKTVPSEIKIFDRQGKKALELSGYNIYFGSGSDLKYTIDWKTKKRRSSTLKDVELSAKLCDKLANIDFVMSNALPQEIAGNNNEYEQFKAMFSNTNKPVIITNFSDKSIMEKTHKFASDLCGGEEGFKSSPNYILYSQFISPLQFHSESLDRLSYCAKKSIPIIYVPTIMMGATGPVTVAGAIGLANAECLAGLIIHQLINPGSPYIYGGCISPLDMKTSMFSYGSPEWRITDSVLSQLSKFYKIPIFGTAGATDSNIVNVQAGAEWAYSLLMSALCGTNLIHDVGYRESGLTGSLESLVICNEIIGKVKRIISGFEVNKDTLAFDIIKEVGPGGNFLSKDHTLKYFLDEVWYPTVFVRRKTEIEALDKQDEVSDLTEKLIKKILV